jgi:hypothetical protein
MMANPSNDPVVCENDGTLKIVEEALGSMWAVANTLSRIRAAHRERYTVTVFGSARLEPGQQLYDQVKELTRVLAEHGCDIVTGGGPGIMQAANEGAQLGDPGDRARSIGVRVALPFEQGSNPFVDQVYTHQTFYTRLHQFVRLSDAFVVVGGGLGTLLELALVWQLLQVRHLTGVPLILVGSMWRELVAWSKTHMLASVPQFANADDLDIPICVDTMDEAIVLLVPRIDAFAERRKAQR